MQEFSSVTASSYDADSLTPLLNEKSAEGWSVVSIVSAGTNIVAYLSREGDGSAVAADAAPAETEAVEETTAAEAPADDAGAAPFVPGAAAGAAVAADAATEATPDPVEEPAGWSSAPEETADDSVASLAAEVGAAEEAPAAEPAATEAAAEPAAAEAAAEPAAETAQAAAPESAVPAGWYADPSGRFELRYWDGAAWTEHVSRAGQQFTDPPVA